MGPLHFFSISDPVKAEFYFENDVCCVTHNIMFINV